MNDSKYCGFALQATSTAELVRKYLQIANAQAWNVNFITLAMNDKEKDTFNCLSIKLAIKRSFLSGRDCNEHNGYIRLYNVVLTTLSVSGMSLINS